MYFSIMVSIVLLGAGNVATHLYTAFQQTPKVVVKQWYARSLSAVKSHASEVAITNNLDEITLADVYVLAVSDTAVASLSSALPFSERLVVHTSGSVGIHDLDKKNNRGVFYPLQSISKHATVDFKTIPICIEVLRKEDLLPLTTLAEAINSPWRKVNSEQRAALHLAAVFANNFTNQLYRIAHEITEQKSASFDLLKPLIKETARKLDELTPYLAQTGPAVRNDTKTIKKHLQLLTNTQHKAIYKLLTQSIQETHGTKKL